MRISTIATLVTLAGATHALALDAQPDIAPVEQTWTDLAIMAHAPEGGGGWTGERSVVASVIVHAPAGSAWARLSLRGTTLAGTAGADGALLRLTSLGDGAVQLMDGEALHHWQHTSAYLNGDVVLVEVLAHDGQGESTLRIDGVWSGSGPSPFGTRSICDGTDDRVASQDRRAGRLTNGCTGWLVNDANGSGWTAGHCGITSGVLGFQVPLSTSSGSYVQPAPQDQYPVDLASVQGVNGGTGNDWRVYGMFVNSNTGLTARQAQGEWFTIASTVPAVTSGAQIRITGYGTTSAPVSPTLNGAQKTHVGPYTSYSGSLLRYRPDTTGGNSGSPVIYEPTGEAIGIHTHGGCNATGGSNIGTALNNAAFTSARSNPLGVAASGVAHAGAVVAAPVLVLGDEANNLGRLDHVTGRYGRIATVGSRWQGLAYDPYLERLYAINTARQLFTLNADGSGLTSLGTITGTSATIAGLAFDLTSRTLYGVSNGDGRLHSIDTTTLLATPRSSVSAFRFTALEWDTFTGQLLAIDANSTGPRLVRINQETGSMTLVGSLGLGSGASVSGLARVDDMLISINASTDQAMTIDNTTGVATVRGASGGSFGASLGMATLVSAPCAIDIDFNNDGLFPDTADLVDLLAALAGGACEGCDSIDVNADGLFPDDADLVAFLSVLAGGSGC